jgi:hypothetical protein
MRFNTAAAATVAIVMILSSVLQANTVSKKIAFVNDKFVPVDLVSEGIALKEARFSVSGGTNFNPLRAGAGPQAFLVIHNTSDHGMHVAAAVAFFDATGNLIGAAEGNNTGILDPDEKNEIKITFGYVKRSMADAKTVQIALETWR